MMRKSDPNVARPFRAPLVPLVPILGIVVCSGMIIALDTLTQITAFVWMLIGFGVYFMYSRSHSKLNS
jgi:APA family basic amino acid/polyamine antiporter